MSDGGKGSNPRPFSVSHEEWTNRWDAIFQREKDSSGVAQAVERQTHNLEVGGSIPSPATKNEKTA